MAANDAGVLAESEFIHEHWYGVPLAGITQALEGITPHTVILSPGGAARIKAMWPAQVIVVAIAPPDRAALQKRLQARGTPESEMPDRLGDVGSGWSEADTADVVITNDDWNIAYANLVRVIEGSR
jgi:guanylate kinase